MKKYLFFFLLTFGFVFAQAQVTYAPDPFFVSGDASGEDLQTELLLTQTYTDEAVLYWQLRKDRFPQEWESSVCDLFTCYQPNVDKSSKNHGNHMNSGTTYHWSIHLNPNDVAGYDTTYLDLYDDKDFTNLVETVVVIFDVGLVGTTNVENTDIQIYPNPSRNYFKVLDDKDVRKISIFNVVGKKLQTNLHNEGDFHDISELQRGMYLVRLLDDKDNILKVVRMTKK